MRESVNFDGYALVEVIFNDLGMVPPKSSDQDLPQSSMHRLPVNTPRMVSVIPPFPMMPFMAIQTIRGMLT